jgi:hypothetical protein
MTSANDNEEPPPSGRQAVWTSSNDEDEFVGPPDPFIWARDEEGQIDHWKVALWKDKMAAVERAQAGDEKAKELLSYFDSDATTSSMRHGRIED